MNPINNSHDGFNPTDYLNDAYDYFVDAFQRSVLFMDIMRKRGNIYFEHKKNNKPPVLTFDYDVIMDGRDLERPVNFSLVRISDRRNKELKLSEGLDKRQNPVEQAPYDPQKRPIIVVDPRAGHGPGIGGAKRDSEIGMALNEGHPVYFFVFSADPVKGQTLTDVHHAQINFIEEIIRRHPEAEKPAIIGNCQAGWASALIGADRPDITGPMVFNGSPLSYWAGVDGKNPMRYKGGLYGGVWLTSLWNDLGNGIFDGANLVAGFEDLNPANTFWNKQYNLYANVDTEEQRYLDFERWWNGYFMMTREEIHYIVDNLFVGNKLEEGQLELEGRRIDLKNLKDPVLVFASNGDNITPPQQALNWIVKVWKSVDEIKQRQQVVVYLVHETIGHLGIFVSGQVSRKEHKEIIASIDLIEYLSPGLYEMIIEKDESEDRHKVRFETRGMDDILALDDGLKDEDDFLPVAAISEINDGLYRTFVSPWVQSAVNDFSAEWLRQLHPLRISRYAFADINPWMHIFQFLAPQVKENRRPVSPENAFVKLEKNVSQLISDSLNLYRDVRDQNQEFWFKAVYGNPWMLSFFKKSAEKTADDTDKENTCLVEWLDMLEDGGFAEGVVRIMVAMAHTDESLKRQVLKTYKQIIAADKRLKNLKEGEFKQMVRQQSCILHADRDKALNALPKLIPDKKDQAAAIKIAEQVALADQVFNDEEKALISRIRTSLGL
ncbi:MAG: DUF3141 domain-containing protein [Desulfobacteraceae bacterium]|nr:DUF3141 domain-containing protein [Desulfobacteraceae bacterium]MBC2757425.1 DUF3141 domain-containing protein [Desulfobacteraceae bacterium]MBC2763829.1 DUF3141 domain-containing protein [ANME-2 cluster archaeon]